MYVLSIWPVGGTLGRVPGNGTDDDVGCSSNHSPTSARKIGPGRHAGHEENWGAHLYLIDSTSARRRGQASRVNPPRDILVNI